MTLIKKKTFEKDMLGFLLAFQKDSKMYLFKFMKRYCFLSKLNKLKK